MKTIKLTIAKTSLAVLLSGSCVNTGWAESAREKVKEWIDSGSESLKNGVDAIGNNFNEIQDYLNRYHWKGLVEENASSGSATLKHLKLNGNPRAVVVKPGEEIQAEVECNIDPDKCSVLGIYRVVVGLHGEGPQAVIGNESGLAARETKEVFTLTAPSQPGMYQVRFKCVDALLKTTALNAWEDAKGDGPDGTTTIGIIFVK